MSRSLKTVIVNGSLSRPSRTRVQLDALQARLGQELPLQAQVIDLLDLQPHLGAALSKNDLPPATGGSPRHALILDHQLRPLFGFFSALTLPIGVYATPEDIQDGQVRSESLRQRIELTVQLSAPVLRGALQQLAQAPSQAQPAVAEPA
jgi:FMN reductase